MARDDERRTRAAQQPIVAGLPDVPGIGVAMRLTPGLGIHLRGLADQLLVDDYPGATISRQEREFLATTVSASNDCFFCMDSHGAHAKAIIARAGGSEGLEIIDDLKTGATERLGPKMAALARISRTVARRSLDLTAADVDRATAAGASDGDVQLAILIAAGFSMYNRMVDGFRARTAPVVEAYDARAAEIAERGYAAPSALTPPAPMPTAAAASAPAPGRGRRRESA